MQDVASAASRTPIAWAKVRRPTSIGGYALVGGLVVLLAALIVYPCALLLYGAVSKASPQQLVFAADNFTADRLVWLFTSSTLHNALLNSIIAAAIGTVTALAIATIFVWIVARTNVPLRGVIGFIAITPLFLSEVIAGIAWARLGFAHSGIINTLLHDIGISWEIDVSTLFGIGFLMGIYMVPYGYLLLIGSARNLDPALEEVSAVCGASPFQTFRRVILPLLSYAYFGAAIMIFVVLLAAYGIPSVLGPNAQIEFATTFMFRLITGEPPDVQSATAVGVLLSVLTLLWIGIHTWIFSRRRAVTVGGRAFQPRLTNVRGWKYPLLAFAFLYGFCFVVVPYLVLIMFVFHRTQFFAHIWDFLSVADFSFDNLNYVFSEFGTTQAIWNTIEVAIALCIVGPLFCLVAAYVVERTKLPGRGLIAVMASLPVAIPGIIIGLGFLWAWISFPIYGTLVILVLAFLARHVADGLRPISATLRQIHEELEEAAWVCGAGWLRTTRRVMLPLVRHGMQSVVILFFVYAVREVGPVLFLSNSGTRLMAVQALDSWNQGDVSGATVIALLQSSLLTAVLLIARFVFRLQIIP